MNQKLNKNITGINNRSLIKLSHYDWPGNIRELQNILEREVILSNSKILNIKQNFNHHPKNSTSTKRTLAEVEKNYIIEVLTACQWRIGGNAGAAKILGVPDSTLRSKMKKLNIVR